MTVKSFRGSTIEEAMAKVSAACGPDAHILETRRIGRDGVLGFLRRPVFEVVVGIRDARPAAAKKPPGPAAPRAVESP